MADTGIRRRVGNLDAYRTFIPSSRYLTMGHTSGKRRRHIVDHYNVVKDKLIEYERLWRG